MQDLREDGEDGVTRPSIHEPDRKPRKSKPARETQDAGLKTGATKPREPKTHTQMRRVEHPREETKTQVQKANLGHPQEKPRMPV